MQVGWIGNSELPKAIKVSVNAKTLAICDRLKTYTGGTLILTQGMQAEAPQCS